MFCNNCGKNMGDFVFCPYCGTKASVPEKAFQQPAAVYQKYTPPKAVKELPQSPKEAKNVFIVGLMSLVLFALPILLYVGYLWFIGNILNRHINNENFRNLAYMIPVGSAIAVIIAIIAKILFKRYINSNQDYPQKVRAGRILYTVAFTIGVVLLSFFCIDRICHFTL